MTALARVTHIIDLTAQHIISRTAGATHKMYIGTYSHEREARQCETDITVLREKERKKKHSPVKRPGSNSSSESHRTRAVASRKIRNNADRFGYIINRTRDNLSQSIVLHFTQRQVYIYVLGREHSARCVCNTCVYVYVYMHNVLLVLPHKNTEPYL